MIFKSASTISGEHTCRLVECVPILDGHGTLALECKFVVAGGRSREQSVFLTLPAEKKAFRQLAKALTPKEGRRKGARVEARKLIGSVCMLHVGDGYAGMERCAPVEKVEPAASPS